MSNDRQVKSNKQNAQQSTGPCTADGKARVASNALKHGLTGKQIVLPNENSEDFDAFKVGLASDLNPQGELEEVLVEKIAADFWRLRRVPVLEAALHRRARMLAMEAGLGEADEAVIATCRSKGVQIPLQICGAMKLRCPDLRREPSTNCSASRRQGPASASRHQPQWMSTSI